MTHDAFCVFILSHGRPDNVQTITALERCGYSGDWFIVVDNEDATRARYVERYGSARVLEFDKLAVSRTFDTGDLSHDRRTVVFARNACFELARQLGYEYFLQLDDDYSDFRYRYQDGDVLRGTKIGNLDGLVKSMLGFLKSTPVTSVALAQPGDLLGGAAGNEWRKRVLRKAMNSFFCRSSDDWRFVGRLNEDVNAYTVLAHRGHLFLTTTYAAVYPAATQQNAGGMTEVYLDGGTYVKSFFTVMMCPSAVSVAVMRSTHGRIHHRVIDNHVAPKILSECHRKAAA